MLYSFPSYHAICGNVGHLNIERKNNPMSKFGKAFRKERIEREITLRRISEHVAKSISYLSDVEHGRRGVPDLKTVALIEEALGVNDGHLVRLASQLQRSVPPQVIEEVQTQPRISDFLMRVSDAELSEDDLNEMLNDFLAKTKE